MGSDSLFRGFIFLSPVCRDAPRSGPGGGALDRLWDRHQSHSGHRRQSGGRGGRDYFVVSTSRSAAAALSGMTIRSGKLIARIWEPRFSIANTSDHALLSAI